MNEPNDAIDAVLNALGGAEPSAGFEARMHHALQHAEAPKRTWRTSYVFATSVATLLCAIAIGLGLDARRTEPSAAAGIHHRPVLLNGLTSAPEVAVVQRVTHTHAARMVRANHPVHAEVETATTHENIPPPPLPLTNEEKLVIRMMRHNDLPQLAVLSDDVRTRSLHDDAEAYRERFAPRPALNGQPYYEQHIITGDSQ